jgi:hypothetical protein
VTRQPIVGPAAWYGQEMAASTSWSHALSPAMLGELDTALRAVQRRGLVWHDVTPDDFPLPTVAGVLDRVVHHLEHGPGVALLRGLPAARYSDEELRQLFWGIGTHLGVARYQNAAGELMGEVRDEVRLYGGVQELRETLDAGTRQSSRAKTRANGPLRFHTDRADVVGLLCARQARRGGLSKIVSSVTIANEMLARRPDLYDLLCNDYYRSREGEEVGGAGSYYALPVFAVHQGYFTSQYSRTYVEAAQRLSDVPHLTPEQDEALDMLADLAEELCFTMRFEPGDMQFLNNHVIYHARTAYEDDPEPGRDRLLYRLWLAMPNSRPLPAGFEVLWGRTEPGAVRGGIAQLAKQV